MSDRPNIICIVSDTLRVGYLGCYGNKLIHTPNLDAFASESIVFDNAHPESLPTIPYRRGLHTGRRAYPFRDYRPVSWDNIYLPGWQPMELKAKPLISHEYPLDKAPEACEEIIQSPEKTLAVILKP